MKEYGVKLKEWWSNLAPREKQAVTWGGALLGIFIIYQGIWSPYVDHIASMRNSIKSNQKTLVFMQEADKEIQKKESQSNTKAKTTSPVALLGFLQKQINQSQLNQQLTQLKQATNDSIELHFQKIEFDKLMNFLIKIVKEQSVSITQLSATAESSPGVVNADVMLKIKM